MSADILIIKLCALGDIVQALGPMAAIRRHHAEARVTLLTTAPYADFAVASGLIDNVWVDPRPSLAAAGKWLVLRRRLCAAGFTRVYDLQTSDRSGWYYKLFWPGPKPEWSGIAHGCSHPHVNPARDSLHTIERQREQLAMAGILDVPAPSINWPAAGLGARDPGKAFALLVPGGASHRPEKRWPAEYFVVLARQLDAEGLRPVLVGGPHDAALTNEIAGQISGALDLGGRTSIVDLAALGQRAGLAVGNDTGPMHLFAVAGAPSVVLYSYESDPGLCAQRGSAVKILRRPQLVDLAVEEVIAAALAARGS